jgi:hypothetical protein
LEASHRIIQQQPQRFAVSLLEPDSSPVQVSVAERKRITGTKSGVENSTPSVGVSMIRRSTYFSCRTFLYCSVCDFLLRLTGGLQFTLPE